MHLIPDTSSHLHMLVSVFPFVGLIFVLGFYITSIGTNNEFMKRFCLLSIGILAILAIPTYMSGDGSMATLSQNPQITQDTQDRMFYHLAWGWAALSVLALAGVAAFGALFRTPSTQRLSDNSLHLVLGLSLITLCLMIVVGGSPDRHRHAAFRQRYRGRAIDLAGLVARPYDLEPLPDGRVRDYARLLYYRAAQ